MENGKVKSLVDKMTCTLKAISGGVAWFESALDVAIDGGSTSKYRQYAGFFVTH